MYLISKIMNSINRIKIICLLHKFKIMYSKLVRKWIKDAHFVIINSDISNIL